MTLDTEAPAVDPARFERLPLGPWLALALAVILAGIWLANTYHQDHLQIARREQDRLLTQARVIDKNLSRQLEAVHLALRDVVRELPSWKDRNNGEARQHLTALCNVMPGVRTINILDAGGTIWASNRPELIGLNFKQREYFINAKEAADPALLQLGSPYLTTLGVWALNLVLMIPGPDKTFDGVVTATLDPEYFSILMHSVIYAPDMWAAIAHEDGLQFLMTPEREGMAGLNLAKPGSFFSRHRDSGRKESFLTGTVLATGERRMMAMETIKPANLPLDKSLIVAVGRDLDALYAIWRHDLAVDCVLFGLACLAAAAGLYFHQRRRREYLRREARDELALRQARDELELRVVERTAALRQALDELGLAKDRAESANRMKGEFLANISHELRTPLNPIIGMADLLMDSATDPGDRQCLASIRQAAGRLHRMIEDLIALTGLDTYTSRLEPVSLGSLLDALKAKIDPEAREKGLELGLAIDPELPLLVSADAGLLSKLFEILTANAVKFTHEGRVDIELSLVSRIEDGVLARFQVSDTGVGIAPDKLGEITLGLTQAEAVLTKRHGGLGLGLATARKICDLLGCKLEAVSVQGERTVFGSVLHLKACDPAAGDECFGDNGSGPDHPS